MISRACGNPAHGFREEVFHIISLWKLFIPGAGPALITGA